MKNILTLTTILMICFSGRTFAQVTGINTVNPDESSVLEVTATDKGMLIPRVDLTSITLDLDGVAGQAESLLVYNTGSTLENGFYYWDGVQWAKLLDSADDTGGPIGIGETITAIYSVPAATATNAAFNLGDYVTANGLTPLPTLDGLEMNLQGQSGDLYRPRIFNRSGSTQLISLQTFATQVNQNRTELNLNLANDDFTLIDNDDLVYWSTNNAEVITTNLQVQIDPNTYRWYEFKWWCMEVAGDKKIFLSVRRVG